MLGPKLVVMSRVPNTSDATKGTGLLSVPAYSQYMLKCL